DVSAPLYVASAEFNVCGPGSSPPAVNVIDSKKSCGSAPFSATVKLFGLEPPPTPTAPTSPISAPPTLSGTLGVSGSGVKPDPAATENSGVINPSNELT